METLQAIPFNHQVGGHHACGKLYGAQALIAKPLETSGRERQFYEQYSSEHESIRAFIPEYHGVKPVIFTEPSISGEESFIELDHTPPSKPTQIDDDTSSDSLQSGANPWALHCYQNQVEKNKQVGVDVNTCIVLEDLTANFEHPCILDMKMGTRAYPDDAPKHKKERALLKAASTTSHELGFRACGMQVYDEGSGKYLCHNKYYGRNLTKDTVKDSLKEFFFVSSTFPKERGYVILKKVIAALHELELAVTSCVGVRFYSSSLLIIYDGSSSNDNVLVKMIDFAHTSYYTEAQDPELAKTPDDGYLFGIRNLIEFFDSLFHEESSPLED